ncbi:ABC transporter permease [Nocardioides sambongensis]|uniref:ABC transporter permease n=1 Tax=Nocardioides sambongensis TaxID=2589074 RepID=UPI001E42AE2B|nr:ABC transporter permease [Nocardioides sambongensis]
MRTTALLRKIAQVVVAPLIALAIALAVTSLVVVLAGNSVSVFFEVMLTPPSQRIWVNIVNQTAMLFLAGMAAAIAFRMNLFNIGIEGQYTLASYSGALVAGMALFPGTLNILAALVVAMAVGAAWAAIAGILKVTRGVSEVISTIMLNSIAITLVGWLLNTYGDQYGQGRRTTPIPESSQLLGLSLGVFDTTTGGVFALSSLALIVGIVFALVINRSRFGFDLRATGGNEAAAVASGVQVKRMIVIAMLMSGGVAGLIWMPDLFGGADYYGTPFQSGLGFTGLAVALLGRNRPLGVAFGALLFAWLSVQANPLGLKADISPSVVQITQGVVVLVVVVVYEVVRRWGAAAEQRALRSTLDGATAGGQA